MTQAEPNTGSWDIAAIGRRIKSAMEHPDNARENSTQARAIMAELAKEACFAPAQARFLDYVVGSIALESFYNGRFDQKQEDQEIEQSIRYTSIQESQ